MLSAFSIGRAQRPALSRRINEGLRETQLWRLNDESFAVLQKLLPEGLFTDRQGSNDGWIEDLTIYSEGRVRLGVITHEHEAVLELTDRERDHLRGVAILP